MNAKKKLNLKPKLKYYIPPKPPENLIEIMVIIGFVLLVIGLL